LAHGQQEHNASTQRTLLKDSQLLMNIQGPILLFFVCVSLFGSITAASLTLSPPPIQENVALRKPLVGSLFASVCILGIIAIFLPGQCSEVSHARKKGKEKDFDMKPFSSRSAPVGFEGHHADCGEFSSHIIRIGGHVLCAACTGLLLGSLVSTAGTALYFFGGWQSGHIGILAVLIGQIGIILGLAQFKFAGYARLILNAFYVLSAFLTLFGIDEHSGNLFIDLYVIGIIVFWILTRILISQWDHSRTCSRCQVPC